MRKGLKATARAFQQLRKQHASFSLYDVSCAQKATFGDLQWDTNKQLKPSATKTGRLLLQQCSLNTVRTPRIEARISGACDNDDNNEDGEDDEHDCDDNCHCRGEGDVRE